MSQAVYIPVSRESVLLCVSHSLLGLVISDTGNFSLSERLFNTVQSGAGIFQKEDSAVPSGPREPDFCISWPY